MTATAIRTEPCIRCWRTIKDMRTAAADI
ncbi:MULTISPECIES: zinc finger domain-containing protein [Paenibacillus]